MDSNPLKWHGGKSYLAKRIIELMPPRCKNPGSPSEDDKGWLHFVETYAGGLAVLLAMDPVGISEVVNDLSLELTNFWKVLQDKRAFQEFKEIVEATPFSFVEFADSDIRNNRPRVHPNVDAAVSFFVACRQSLAGRMQGFTGITRSRTRKGMNEQVSAWISAIEGLPLVHERLKRVLILSSPALKVIRSQDGPRTLFYLDPPYLHETRATADEYGEYEMDSGEHEKLLAALSTIEGRFLLSGYHSEMYDGAAARYGWKCHEFEIDNKAAGGKTKRIMTECVWCNF